MDEVTREIERARRNATRIRELKKQVELALREGPKGPPAPRPTKTTPAWVRG